MRRLALALTIVIAACGDAKPVPDASPGATDAPAEYVHLLGTVEDEAAMPLEGARVCVTAQADVPCVISDHAGSYVVEPLPLSGTDLAVQATLPGYLGRVVLVNQDVPPYRLLLPLKTPSSAMALLATHAGLAYPDPGNGFLRVQVDNQPEGATATLSVPATGPVYADPLGTPDPSRTATSSSGVILFGGIAPGRVTVIVRRAGLTCTARPYGTLMEGDWPASGAGSVDAEVAADSLTDDVVVLCN